VKKAGLCVGASKPNPVPLELAERRLLERITPTLGLWFRTDGRRTNQQLWEAPLPFADTLRVEMGLVPARRAFAQP